MIPRKFHTNLPHKLQKLATLFIPNGKLWHVEICRTGQDIYLKKGWSEFAKAHDLRTGYFVVFRYEGNMIFKVKIFDTSGCLKKYSLASHDQRRASAYIEIETSSETETGAQTPRESPHETTSDNLAKRRKLANGDAHEIVKREDAPPQKILPEKKNKKRIFDSTCSRQFKKILAPYSILKGFISIPKEFCVNNGLLTMRTIYLRKSSSEGRSWPVQFYLRASHGDLGKGWREFSEAAGLQEGDHCVFQLVSENSFVVDVISQMSNSDRERKGKVIEGSTSSTGALEEKHVQQINQYSRPMLEWGSTVRKYHLTHYYLSLSRKFCMENNLTSDRVVTLRNQTGKEWKVKFYLHVTEGRLNHMAWTEFSSEYGLKVGDQCIFKLIEKDVLLVRVVKSMCSSMKQLELEESKK